MKKIFSLLAAGTMVLGASTGAFAQETARAAAERIDACNDHPIVTARWLESGRLEVTCPAGSISGNTWANGLNPTNVAAAGGLIILTFLVGNSSSSSTTTTGS